MRTIDEKVAEKAAKLGLDAHGRETYRNMLVREAKAEEAWGEKSLADYQPADEGMDWSDNEN